MSCGRSSARGDFPSWTVAGSTPTARATIPGYDVIKWSDVKPAVD